MDITSMERDELIQQAETLRTVYNSWAGRPDSHPLALERTGTALQGVATAIKGALAIALGGQDAADYTWHECISSGEDINTCLPRAACPEGCGVQVVIDAKSNPGFTGATIYFWKLACGHSDQDLSEDNLDAAR